MKDLAAGLIIGALLVSFVMIGIFIIDDSAGWVTQRSPETGVCYEISMNPHMFGWGTAMSPVDGSYCEDE